MSRKQLTINMVANIVSFIISSSISLFLSPYIINTVGKEAYGFVGLANNFVQYASLITVALNSMGGRFITIKIHEDDMVGANRYFNSILIANLVMALIMMVPSIVIVLFIKNIISVPAKILIDIQLLWAFIFLDFIISMVTSTLGVATFAMNRLDLSSILSIKANIIKAIILIITFAIFEPFVWYVGFASFCSTIFITIINIKYTRELLPRIQISKIYFNIMAIKEVVSAGVWNSFSKMANILSNGLDLLISNIFINSSAMGTLAISKTIPGMILTIGGILSSVFSPNFTIFYAKKKYGRFKKRTNNINEVFRVCYEHSISLFFCIWTSILLTMGTK